MSIICGDGFDHYFNGGAPGSPLAQKWDVVIGSGIPQIVPNDDDAQTGRFGTNAMKLRTDPARYVQRNLPNLATFGLGFAIRPTVMTIFSYPIVEFRDSSLRQLTLNLRSDLRLEIRNYNGANNPVSTLAISDTSLIGNTWNYVQVKVTFNATTGSVEVRFGDVTVINVSPVVTRNTASVLNGITNFIFGSSTDGGSSEAYYIDDVICWDTAGGIHDDFLGDVHIQALLPVADGPVTQWTPQGAGANYQCVNENPPDGDTTYVESSTSGNKDLYHFPDVSPPNPSQARIVAVLQNIDCRKTGGGTEPIQATCRSNTSDFDAPSSFEPGSDYHIFQFQNFTVWETDPDAGVEWDIARLNDANAATRAYFGHKLP